MLYNSQHQRPEILSTETYFEIPKQSLYNTSFLNFSSFDSFHSSKLWLKFNWQSLTRPMDPFNIFDYLNLWAHQFKTMKSKRWHKATKDSSQSALWCHWLDLPNGYIDYIWNVIKANSKDIFHLTMQTYINTDHIQMLASEQDLVDLHIGLEGFENYFCDILETNLY